MTSDDEHLFMYLFALHISSLEKCVLRPFVYFKIEFYYHFVIEFALFIYFEFYRIIRRMACRHFFPIL